MPAPLLTRHAILFPYLLFLSGAVFASPPDAARAQQNYTLNCQGCHLADASGMEGRVPRLRGSVGKFLRVKGGREYLIRVPGVATTPLDDAALAELMNWLLQEFSAAELPADFAPYTAAEVASLRRRPLNDVESVRAGLLREQQLPAP